MFIAWYVAQDSEDDYFLHGIFDAVVGQGMRIENEQLEAIPDGIEVEVFMSQAAAQSWLDEKHALYEPC